MLNSSGTATEYVLIHIISLSFESEILHKFFPVSFHAATDEETPQKISPQDTLYLFTFTTICAELLSSLNLLMSPLVIAICSQGGFFVPREVCRLTE